MIYSSMLSRGVDGGFPWFLWTHTWFGYLNTPQTETQDLCPSATHLNLFSSLLSPGKSTGLTV